MADDKTPYMMAMQQLAGGKVSPNPLTEIIAAANKDRDIAKARIEKLEVALREIAGQNLSDEQDEETQDSADYQGGYDILIGLARAALAPEQDK